MGCQKIVRKFTFVGLGLFLFKSAQFFDRKLPFWKNLKVKLNLWAPVNSSCLKFAVFVEKSLLYASLCSGFYFYILGERSLRPVKNGGFVEGVDQNSSPYFSLGNIHL